VVPLTTLQGLPAGELAALIGDRPVYLWGTGDIGLDVLTSLRRSGIAPAAYLHSQPRTGASHHGFPVLDAATRLAAAPAPFVVIASQQFRRQAEAVCQQAGLVAGRDYLTHLAIRRPTAVIEVASGTGNHGCLAARERPTQFMSAARFQSVLGKLLADQPQLCHVELSWLGDPLANPEIADIVARCEAVVPCTINTPLLDDTRLPAVIDAAPSRLNIVVSSYGENHSEMTGGDGWPAFLTRLERLKALLVEYGSATRTMLRYIRTRDEPPEHLAAWQELLKGSDISLSVEYPYLAPYDPLLARCDGMATDAASERILSRLTWQLDPVLALCREDRENPCLSQRVFPVIGADLKVGLCHLYETPIIADDYLATPWEDLLERRHADGHCTHCQQHGLHRLDLPVLQQRFPARFPQFLSQTP